MHRGITLALIGMQSNVRSEVAALITLVSGSTGRAAPAEKGGWAAQSRQEIRGVMGSGGKAFIDTLDRPAIHP